MLKYLRRLLLPPTAKALQERAERNARREAAERARLEREREREKEANDQSV